MRFFTLQPGAGQSPPLRRGGRTPETKKAPIRRLSLYSWKASSKPSRLFGRLFGAEYTETLLEAIDTAAGVQDFLLTGVERVALGANVEADVLAQGRAGLDDVTAAAGSFDRYVFGMDF
eukprot:gene16968-20749_t